MDLFRVVSLIHDVEIEISDSVALFQEFFSVRDIVDRVLEDLQTGDNLTNSIDGDRSFQESLSRFTGPPGVIMAGVRAGEPG